MKEVRVRIAPSPTGDPHVGTAYIALFNYAMAKHNGDGKFLLRIEDTDRTRSNKESEQQIFDSLKWLGLNYDEGPDVGGEFGPYRQSERESIYKEYVKKLIDNGTAYYCFCTSERLTSLREKQKELKQDLGYDGHCRDLSKDEVEKKIAEGTSYVIRLRMPKEGQTIVNDRLRKEIVFENARIDDQVLLKSDGFPTYHLASVVDDHLMGITHVIRAEEWIISTTKHVRLYQSFGWVEPEWIHMPLLRNSDKTKISKRKNPVSLLYYKEKGYLKEAIVNFLALMGWSIGDDREKFTLDEMIKDFNIDNVSLGGPVFDLQKLAWLNNLYMREKDIDELADLAKPFYVKAGYISEDVSGDNYEAYKKALNVARESAETLSDLPLKSKIFFEDDFELPVEEEGMNKKQRKSLKRLYSALEDEVGKASIRLYLEKLESLEEKVSEDEAKAMLNGIMDEIGEGPGKVLMPLRVVTTGSASGADLYNVISIIGKTRTINRVKKIVEKNSIL